MAVGRSSSFQAAVEAWLDMFRQARLALGAWSHSI